MRRSGRAVVLAGLAGVVAVAFGAGIAWSLVGGDETADGGSVQAPLEGSAGLKPPLEGSAGLKQFQEQMRQPTIGVVDRQGRSRGSMPTEVFMSDSTDVVPVVDEDGNTTGYYTAGVGFLERAEVEVPDFDRDRVIEERGFEVRQFDDSGEIEVEP